MTTLEFMHAVEHERTVRQQAWEAFIETVRAFGTDRGWPDTLRAVSQAMQADERHKRELFERR